MGTIILKTIIVTCYEEADAADAHEKAVELLGDLVSNQVSSTTNGYVTFMVAPDGSKLGWPTHDDANQLRELLLSWLKEMGRADVVHIEYGETEAAIIKTN